jgi:hypothetical protein
MTPASSNDKATLKILFLGTLALAVTCTVLALRTGVYGIEMFPAIMLGVSIAKSLDLRDQIFIENNKLYLGTSTKILGAPTIYSEIKIESIVSIKKMIKDRAGQIIYEIELSEAAGSKHKLIVSDLFYGLPKTKRPKLKMFQYPNETEKLFLAMGLPVEAIGHLKK